MMKHSVAASSMAILALMIGGSAVAVSASGKPSPVPAWADSGSHRSGGGAKRVEAAKAVEVNRRVFDTSDNRFDQRVDNQGWWNKSLANSDDNDNYLVGAAGEAGRFRDFFTFDLSMLRAKAVGATLVLRRYRGEGDFTETLGLFDVRTAAKRLNNNDGVDVRIYRDLGSGTGYGRYVLPTHGAGTKAVRLRLNAAAIADLNAARGGFFSIGGEVLSIKKPPARQFLFGNSEGRGVQRLVVFVEPPT
jgi:hypothetical protein